MVDSGPQKRWLNPIKGDFMRATHSLVGTAMILVVFGTMLQAAAQTSDSDAGAPGFVNAYCTLSGGLAESRQAVYGTNGPPQDWLRLAATQDFCQYTASDGSRIHINFLTLNTTKPTLAALAYYAQVPWNRKGNGNPASYYCTQLGGAEIGATDLVGGAWVSAGGIDMLLETCIFPDNSTIDSWGLLYHAYGIIRGIDLSTVLQYANPYPAKKKD
jgi:putative hemolysin